MVRAFAIETGTTWDEHVVAVLFAYRFAMHSSAQAYLADFLFGKELRPPLDAERDLYLDRYRMAPYESDFLFQHAEALARARDTARLAMEKAALRSAERYNSGRKLVEYNPGDVVWLENMKLANKFTPRWLGPYRISRWTPQRNLRSLWCERCHHEAPITSEHLKRAVYDLNSYTGDSAYADFHPDSTFPFLQMCLPPILQQMLFR